MKTPDGYRFCLQFPGEPEKYRQVGECLEALGRKKSDFIVRAILEFLERHPEEATGGILRVEVQRTPFNKAELERLVRQILSEQLKETPTGLIRPKESLRTHLQTAMRSLIRL